MTGAQLPGSGEGGVLEQLVGRAEAVSLQLGAWLTDPDGQPEPELAEQLNLMQAIEEAVKDKLGTAVEGREAQLEFALRAVVLAMTQRQQHHGRLSKVASEDLNQCSLLITASGDRILKGLVGAPWAEGAATRAFDGENGRAIERLVHTLVQLVAVGCEPSLWAPLQNTVWAKLNALREAGALGLANPRGRELRQIIGTEVIKRLGDRQRSISALAAAAGGQINADAAGIERHAKVLRFFAAKGIGSVPPDRIELIETLCGIAAETLFVSWHQPRADGGPSSLALAANALLEMLVHLGTELPASSKGVEVLSALASWFSSACSKSVPRLGVLLCLVHLLPLTSSWVSVQQVGAVQPLLQLARSAMQHLCKLSEHKHKDAFDAVYDNTSRSVAQWVATAPLTVHPQLQLFLLEMMLTRGKSAADPEMGVIVVTVWDTALRIIDDADILHAHALTLINLAAGVNSLVPSAQACIRGLLGTICARLSAQAGRAEDDKATGVRIGDSADNLQKLLRTLAEAVHGAERGTGVEPVIPALLQPPSTAVLRLLQDTATQAALQGQQQQDTMLINLGKALCACASAISADAAPFAGAQGQADLTVLLHALKVLIQGNRTTVITPSTLSGIASLLRIATCLDSEPEEQQNQTNLLRSEHKAAARRLRDGCCDVLCAALEGAASIPLLTRLLTTEALAESISTLHSAAAAKSSLALPLFKRCLVSLGAAEASGTVPQHVAAARVWRERSVVNEASQKMLQKCQLQQVENILPNTVAAYAFEYASVTSMLSRTDNTESLRDVVVNHQNDVASEFETHAITDDCWHRPPKRLRPATGAGASTNVANEQVLPLQELIDSWIDAEASGGLPAVLSRVKQLLSAAEAHGVHEMLRQVHQLEQQQQQKRHRT